MIVDFIRPAFEIAIAELNLLDEDGKRLGPNEAISIILDYGLRRANKINRIIPGIKFTECIPQVIADLFRMEGRDEKEKEIFRESVIEKMPEWRVLRKELTQDQWQLLRKIGCGIPSWYSVLKNEAAVEALYADKIRWLRTMHGFQLDIREFLKVAITSVLTKYCPADSTERKRIFGEKVRVCCKIMLDGFKCDHLHAKNLVAVHGNILLLPGDRDKNLAEFFERDEDQ